MSIFEIIMTVLAVLFGLLSVHYSAKNKVTNKVIDYVNEAEKTYNGIVGAGSSKLELVTDKLYSFIPVKFDPFISKDLVRNIVNKVVAIMNNFATKQLDKLDDKIVPETVSSADTINKIVEMQNNLPQKIADMIDNQKTVETPVVATPVENVVPVTTEVVPVVEAIEPAIPVSTETDVK